MIDLSAKFSLIGLQTHFFTEMRGPINVEFHMAHALDDLFVLLLYVPSQQLWSLRDGQFTYPHIFLGKLEQAVNQYFVHILSLVTDNNPS